MPPEPHAHDERYYRKSHVYDHDDLSGVSSDDHHAKSHTHDGADGSGTVAHGSLSGVTANQHHNQAHAIDGADHSGNLTQARSHDSPDTDAAAGSLHHTIGAGATQAAAGNHTHSATFDDSEGDPSAIDPDDAAADGTSAFPARRDHQHQFTCAAPSSTLGGTSSNSEGSASSAARSDHSHDVGTAVPGLTLGTANAEGSSNNLVRVDATILAFDTTDPAAVHLTTADDGVATVAARRDHVHTFPTIPAARVYHDTTQTITTSTEDPVEFNSERFDTDTMHDNVTSNTRLTATTAGKYYVGASIEFAANATGFRGCHLRKNGTTYVAVHNIPAVNGDVTELTTNCLVSLAATDYVQVIAFQTSGGDLTLNSGSEYTPEFWMIRVSS